MPTVIPNGGNDDITSSELTAYDTGLRQDYLAGPQTISVPSSGNQTPQETQLIQAVEEKFDAIVEGWIDSGGPGGLQRAASREILRRAALLQGDMAASVRQWSRPGRERALLEMFGVLTKAISDRDRLLLELRERLNRSPW